LRAFVGGGFHSGLHIRPFGALRFPLDKRSRLTPLAHQLLGKHVIDQRRHDPQQGQKPRRLQLNTYW
jgi:hypothetical protein